MWWVGRVDAKTVYRSTMPGVGVKRIVISAGGDDGGSGRELKTGEKLLKAGTITEP